MIPLCFHPQATCIAPGANALVSLTVPRMERDRVPQSRFLIFRTTTVQVEDLIVSRGGLEPQPDCSLLHLAPLGPICSGSQIDVKRCYLHEGLILTLKLYEPTLKPGYIEAVLWCEFSP